MQPYDAKLQQSVAGSLRFQYHAFEDSLMGIRSSSSLSLLITIIKVIFSQTRFDSYQLKIFFSVQDVMPLSRIRVMIQVPFFLTID